jgi:hypothetical protein
MRGLCLSLALLTTSCVTREIADQDPVQANTTTDIIPVTPRRNVDILFVIDDSSSMEGEQNSLARNFPEFMRVLGEIQGGLPNVHIGVVSSNVGAGEVDECAGEGDDGMLQIGGGDACNAPAEKFLSDIRLDSGERDRNYTGDLEDTFACMAKLGTDGCGLEMHLESMIRAVDGRNPGFIRDDAFLAVIILADEDDCSDPDDAVFAGDNTGTLNLRYQCVTQGLTCEGGEFPVNGAAVELGLCVPAEEKGLPPSGHFVSELRKIKPRSSDILVAVIAGKLGPLKLIPNGSNTDWFPDKTCGGIEGSTNSGAAPAFRLSNFVDLIGPLDASFHSICGTEDPPVEEPDLAPALTQIADRLGSRITNVCLPRSADLTDVQPSKPGVQPACTVVDGLRLGEDDEQRTVIGRCPMENDTTPSLATLPCWWLVPEPSCGDETSQQRIKVEREGTPPLDLDLLIECAAKP